MKEMKEGLLLWYGRRISVELALVDCAWMYIHGFDPTHRNKEAKENRILFMIRG